MEGNIQNMKINNEEIRNYWYALAWLPVFAFINYLFIKGIIAGIEIILYPVELNLLVLIIKLLIVVLVTILIFMVLGFIAFYYDVIKGLIKAYKSNSNKL